MTNDEKYPILRNKITRIVKRYEILLDDEQKLFDIVVDEYEECGDNPEEATTHDIIEISDASCIRYKDEL